MTQITASTTATMNSQWIVKPIPNAMIASTAKRTSSNIESPSFLGSGRITRKSRIGLRIKSGAVELSGKRAIVTGASAGIGRATARGLAAAGVRVAGGARRVERLETDVALPLDVTDPESCARFVGAALDELGGLDILVNN